MNAQGRGCENARVRGSASGRRESRRASGYEDGCESGRPHGNEPHFRLRANVATLETRTASPQGRAEVQRQSNFCETWPRSIDDVLQTQNGKATTSVRRFKAIYITIETLRLIALAPNTQHPSFSTVPSTLIKLKQRGSEMCQHPGNPRSSQSSGKAEFIIGVFSALDFTEPPICGQSTTMPHRIRAN